MTVTSNLRVSPEKATGSDTISLSKKIIVNICQGRDFNSLPLEIKEVVNGEDLQQGNTFPTVEEATSDPSQGIMITVHETKNTDTGNHSGGLNLIGPKEISDVVGHVKVGVIHTSPGDVEASPQRITQPLRVETNSSTRVGISTIGDKEGVEPSQDQHGISRGDSEARKLKQVHTKVNPRRGRNQTAVTILQRRAESVPLGGHVLRPSTLSRRNSRLTCGEPSTKPKPKRSGPARPRTKKESLKEKDKDQLTLNPEGFFEVRVDYQHCANIAEASGVTIQQIDDLLRDDNQNRIAMPIQNQLLQIGEEISDSDLGEHISDFDPLTEDELSSSSV